MSRAVAAIRPWSSAHARRLAYACSTERLTRACSTEVDGALAACSWPLNILQPPRFVPFFPVSKIQHDGPFGRTIQVLTMAAAWKTCDPRFNHRHSLADSGVP